MASLVLPALHTCHFEEEIIDSLDEATV